MTIPGPTGPLPTTRLEVMREGFQQAEARLTCELAIAGGKLTAADRETCRDAVRGIYEMEYTLDAKGGKSRRADSPSANWQDTVKKLYEAAAVAQRGIKPD